MVKKIELKAEKREAGKNSLRKLRVERFIPAVLYGQGGQAEELKISKNDFSRAYEQAGESSLLDLVIDGKQSVKAIIKDVQVDSLKNTVIHADLYRIDMKQPIEIEIPIRFEGESKAEKELGGTLVKSLETIHVRCLPGDLAEYFPVDLGKLNSFEDSIRVADISVKDGIEILSNPDSMIASVLEQQAEEEIKPAAAPVEPAKDAKAAEATAKPAEKTAAK